MSESSHTPTDVLDSPEAGGRFIRGGIYRSAGFALGIGLSLVSVPLMIRHLGPVDYGYFVTVSAVVFIIGGVTEAGLTNLGVRNYSTAAVGERDAVLRHLVGLRLALTLAGVVLACALTAVAGSPSVVVAGVLISGIGLLVAMIQQTYGIPLVVSLRLGWTSALELIKNLFLALGTIGLVIAGASLVPFFVVSIVAGLATLALTLALVRRAGAVAPAFSSQAWTVLLRETLPYAVAAAVGIIYFREAVILMSYLATDTETGYYSAAFRIVEILATVPWMLVSAVFPILARAARDDHSRLAYALQRLFDVALILGLLMTLMLAVGAQFAIDVVAGPGFDPSVPVLRIQSLGLITTFLASVFAFALLSLRMHRELLIANAIAVVVATVATVLLIPPHGAEGAAVAPTVAEACLVLGYAIALARARPDVAPSLKILPGVLLAGALGAAAGFAIPLPSLVSSLLAGAVCFAVLLVTRSIPFEVWNAILRREPEAPA